MSLKMRFLILAILGIAVAVEEKSQVLKEFAVGNNAFTADVYRELVKSNYGNFLVCPLSAEIILALVHTGAGGKTAQQISTTLHLPEDKEKIQAIIKELTPYLRSNNNYTFSSANKIYIQDGLKIKDQFKKTTVDVFDADHQNIDFGKKKQAVCAINKWVEEKTHNKIKNSINKDGVDKNMRAVLMNAMYFHGKWKLPFDKTATAKRPFYLNQQDQVKVEMMRQTDEFKYYESSELNAKFLELPYAGDNVTMTFVLPNDREGLSALEARINDVLVSPIEYSLDDVVVAIPKFKMEATIALENILQSLGIVEAFTDDADFGEILIDGHLKIDKVIQKSFIEVDEEGTTAAAVTDEILVLPISSYNFPQFIADHPFIFYIKIKDVIVFAGKYSSPSSLRK